MKKGVFGKIESLFFFWVGKRVLFFGEENGDLGIWRGKRCFWGENGGFGVKKVLGPPILGGGTDFGVKLGDFGVSR